MDWPVMLAYQLLLLQNWALPNFNMGFFLDLVAEAETMSLQQEIFADLEKICPPHCILTSNSLKFSSKSIGEKTKCHDTMAGFTFSAIILAERGVDVYLIDQAFTSFGMLLGPFRMIDMLGLQVFEAIGRRYVENLPDSSYLIKLISILQQHDYEGESNAKGFYKYDICGMATPNAEIKKYLPKTGNTSYMTIESKLTKLSNDEMVEMILFPAFNEACQLISKGIVTRPFDLDVLLFWEWDSQHIGEESFTGLIPLALLMFIRMWKIGLMYMENFSSPVPT